jgi:hypothetical protein
MYTFSLAHGKRWGKKQVCGEKWFDFKHVEILMAVDIKYNLQSSSNDLDLKYLFIRS